MKKILTLSLLLVSAVIFVPSAEAKSANAVEPQIRVQIGRNRNRNWNRRVRVSNVVRTVRRGRVLYRETYRVTRFANGRTQTRLISRVRVGRLGRRY